MNKSSGKISSILLILAAILIVVIVVVFVVIRTAAIKNANNAKSANSPNPTETPKPVYETTIGDVKFIFESAEDLGGVLKSKNSNYQQDLTTTEKFVKVIIGAQNKGKINFPSQSWDVGNIVDSDGRNFISINDQAYYFLPAQNLCGALLKPEFEPVPCIKLYEVSKSSTKLKVGVNVTNQSSSKRQESFIDLTVN